MGTPPFPIIGSTGYYNEEKIGGSIVLGAVLGSPGASRPFDWFERSCDDATAAIACGYVYW